MTTLIFENRKLQGILRITQQARTFRTIYTEAIKAYEKDTKRKYNNKVSLDEYGEQLNPTLWLVKDEGIYLMTSAKLNEFPIDKSHLCHAKGFEPDTPDWFDRCKDSLGGEDFIESIEFNDELKNGIVNGADIYITITTKNFAIDLVYQ